MYNFCHVTGNQSLTTQQTYQKQTCSQIYRVFIYSRIIYITYQCLCCLCRTAKPCHESNRPAAARPSFQYEMQVIKHDNNYRVLQGNIVIRYKTLQSTETWSREGMTANPLSYFAPTGLKTSDGGNKYYIWQRAHQIQ